MLLNDQRDPWLLIRSLQAELAKHRADIQRLQKALERQQRHPLPVIPAPVPTSSSSSGA